MRRPPTAVRSLIVAVTLPLVARAPGALAGTELDKVEITATRVAGAVWMLTGEGGNRHGPAPLAQPHLHPPPRHWPVGRLNKGAPPAGSECLGCLSEYGWEVTQGDNDRDQHQRKRAHNVCRDKTREGTLNFE